MELLFELTLYTVFVLVIYQDLKMRLVHIVLPLLIFILGMVLNWDTSFSMEWTWSFLFLVLNFLIITFYFSTKKRKYVNPFDTLIGWGDVLFLIAMVPFFSFRGYIQYFVMGMIFSLLLFLVMKSFFPKYGTIPLAGFLSIFFIGTRIIERITSQNFFAESIF